MTDDMASYTQWHELFVIGIINCVLIGFKATPREETHIWCYKSGQELMAGELLGPRGESIPLTLNEHSIKLPSKFVSLHP